MEKICFIISPIGEPDTETRKRSDLVLKHIIIPSVLEFEYNPIRADNISEPGIITSQVIQHIVDSPLVIADLSERNPNVFYELALRHVTKKPLIQIIRKGDQIPFDVAATRIIHFDLQDLDSVANAKSDIQSQINAIESGKGVFDNPVSVSLELKVLKESGNPQERSLAEIVEAISELRNVINVIDRKISTSTDVAIAQFNEYLVKLQESRRVEGSKFLNRSEAHVSTILNKLEELTTKVERADFDRILSEIIDELDKFRDELNVFLITGGSTAYYYPKVYKYPSKDDEAKTIK